MKEGGEKTRKENRQGQRGRKDVRKRGLKRGGGEERRGKRRGEERSVG